MFSCRKKPALLVFAFAFLLWVGSGRAEDGVDTIKLDWAYYNPLSLVLKDKGWLEEEFKKDGDPEFSEIVREGASRASEAEALAEKFEQHAYRAELHRLRGVFLTALGAEEAQIEASFCEAVRIAKEQQAVSLEKRAEATYAEYRARGESVSFRTEAGPGVAVRRRCCRQKQRSLNGC